MRLVIKVQNDWHDDVRLPQVAMRYEILSIILKKTHILKLSVVCERAVSVLLTCSEDVGTSITAQSEVVVMTVGTVRLLILAGEWTINQRDLAVDTLETVFMPVSVLVRQILQSASRRCVVAAATRQIKIKLNCVNSRNSQTCASPSVLAAGLSRVCRGFTRHSCLMYGLGVSDS